MSDKISNKTHVFISERLDFIKTLKNPTDTQKKFAEIAEKYLTKQGELSVEEMRHLKILTAAEQADEKAQKAKQAARKIISEENEKIRKARTHEMIKSAGLLVKAGLVDGKTGKPRTSSPEILLGALIELESRHPTEQEKARWAELGAAAMVKNPTNA